MHLPRGSWSCRGNRAEILDHRAGKGGIVDVVLQSDQPPIVARPKVAFDRGEQRAISGWLEKLTGEAAVGRCVNQLSSGFLVGMDTVGGLEDPHPVCGSLGKTA